MRKTGIVLALLLLLALTVSPVAAAAPQMTSAWWWVPRIQITSVTANTSVTITTFNFPAHDTFKVLMNRYGTLGIGGTEVTTISTGAGGSQTYTFSIPSAFKGMERIAIRLESPTSGFFSYNWFWNAVPTPAPTTTVQRLPPGVIPLITITGVTRDSKVTFSVRNLPASDTFTVLMNRFGTAGLGGVNVGTITTGSGGTQSFTFAIPASLKGLSRIAVRISSSTSGYFSYNWFWNTTFP